MTKAVLEFERYLREANEPFSGWDFGYLTETGRMVESPLPWSYASEVLHHFQGTNSMLDMGTGGGEFLSRLQPLPKHTAATEGYAPNVAIAHERLEPLGVSVHPVEDDASLPFPDNTFDLVINRHESYSPTELHRILKPGGYFITQQVGGDNDNDLNRLLGAPTNDEYAHWNLIYALDELRGAGLVIVDDAEADIFTRFYDLGSVTYYLQAVPWQIADFSTERYHSQLFELHLKIWEQGPLDIPGSRFFIVARRS